MAKRGRVTAGGGRLPAAPVCDGRSLGRILELSQERQGLYRECCRRKVKLSPNELEERRLRIRQIADVELPRAWDERRRQKSGCYECEVGSIKSPALSWD